MPRKARVVAPGFPHHIIQRGNRRQKVFFDDRDKKHYLDLLREQTAKRKVKIWAYCLMDNHVHLVLVPDQKEGLSAALGETHKQYTRTINARNKWQGHLWEGRYKSFIMDERYLVAVMRYVENNPIRAGLVQKPEEYAWSSARGHIFKGSDHLLDQCYLTGEIGNWHEYLSQQKTDEIKQIQDHVDTGKPLGPEGFIRHIEKVTGKIIWEQRPGPKKVNN